MKTFLAFSLVAVLLLTACQHEPMVFPSASTPDNVLPHDSCDPKIVYFEKDILPILNSNCAYSGCHDPGTAQEGIVLNTYVNVLKSGVVMPFAPQSSELIKVVTESDPEDIMPPAPKPRLNSVQLAIISKWISQGAQNIICNSGGCDTLNVKYSTTITGIMNSYCKGCHSGSTSGGGIDLSTHAGVAATALNGKLLGSINHSAGYSPMPKGGNKLNDCQVKQVVIWINGGALNN